MIWWRASSLAPNAPCQAPPQSTLQVHPTPGESEAGMTRVIRQWRQVSATGHIIVERFVTDLSRTATRGNELRRCVPDWKQSRAACRHARTFDGGSSTRGPSASAQDPCARREERSFFTACPALPSACAAATTSSDLRSLPLSMPLSCFSAIVRGGRRRNQLSRVSGIVASAPELLRSTIEVFLAGIAHVRSYC